MVTVLRKIKTKVMQVVGPKLFGGSAWARRLGAQVGAGCRIYFSHFGDQPLGTEPFLITMGDRVTVTSGVKLITHDGSTWLLREEDGTRYQRYAPITIGDDVFIGVDTIVLPGVTIGSNVVIGAGSVVTRDVPSNSVAVGSPARAVKSFDAFREKMRGIAVLDDARFQGMESKERIRAMIASHAPES